MPSEEQLLIVGTGFHATIEDYFASPRYHYDLPALVIRRDGLALSTPCGSPRVLALENAGPVLLHGGSWLPATPDPNGRYQPIPGATPVRAPYEFCTCSPYHGHVHYEYVSDRQLATLRQILAQWLHDSHIRFPYDNQLGALCPRAIAGRSGIYLASSFDPSRSDIHPQREIIDIIKSLAS